MGKNVWEIRITLENEVCERARLQGKRARRKGSKILPSPVD